MGKPPPIAEFALAVQIQKGGGSGPGSVVPNKSSHYKLSGTASPQRLASVDWVYDEPRAGSVYGLRCAIEGAEVRSR